MHSGSVQGVPLGSAPWALDRTMNQQYSPDAYVYSSLQEPHSTLLSSLFYFQGHLFVKSWHADDCQHIAIELGAQLALYLLLEVGYPFF